MKLLATAQGRSAIFIRSILLIALVAGVAFASEAEDLVDDPADPAARRRGRDLDANTVLPVANSLVGVSVVRFALLT